MGIIVVLQQITAEGVAALDPSSERAAIEHVIEQHGGTRHDVDKAWNALHTLYCGDSEGGAAPWCFLQSGGESLPHAPWGSTRLINPRGVHWWRRCLNDVTDDELMADFDPDAWNDSDMYKAGSWSESDRDYLLHHIQGLRAFVTQASRNKCGLLICES